MNIKKFGFDYTRRLIALLEQMDMDAIEKILLAFEQTLDNKGCIYLLGNGGSAATATHMQNDLGIGLKRRGIRNFRIRSLADNTAVTTAISNDIGYDNIFLAQIEDEITDKDILLSISCSGNSPNIIKAVGYAKSVNATIIGLTGFEGGELRKLSDICLHIDTPSGEYGLVEDMHMIFDHLIYSYYIEQNKQEVI